MSAVATLRTIDPAGLHPSDSYRLLISLVVPRPVAWVSTIGADDTPNLAPYSFFNAVAGVPPTVMISVSQRMGQPKDTLRNIRETGEFVVNLADQSLAEALNLTSSEVPYEVDEFALAGLESLPSVVVRPPRVAAAPAALEVRATQIVPVQDSRYTLVLGQVLLVHVREDLLRPNGLVDAARLRPLLRLGGDEFAHLGEVFEMKRPG